MNIIVFGGAGLLGRAVAQALRSRGHQVLTAGRSGCDVSVDFRYDHSPEVFRALVKDADIVVNAVGILIERGNNTFDAVHVQAPRALFAACAAQRVARVLHISALGVGTGIAGAYMASKLAAENALVAALSHDKNCSTDWAIVRPALLVDEACPSTRLFHRLARLPVIALPGVRRAGSSWLAPVAVSDVAQAVARMCEHEKALRRVVELAGPQIMSYREMLMRLRRAHTLRPALWLPLPWWLMKLSSRLAQWLPQNVFSIDTVRLLQAGCVSRHNEMLYWLRHMPKVPIAQYNCAPAAIKSVASTHKA
jgi:uncharacterized protein YbjT (DUF2867 family)